MDSREFEDVVDQHYADLYRFAYSLAKNPDDAADFTQQTFVIFAERGDEIRDPARRKSWLFTTLYREFLKQTARGKRQISMEEKDLEAISQIVPSDAQRVAEHHELLTALASLEEAQRAMLALFYLDQCSYREIAEILDLPIGTVMSRLSRAKNALYHRFQDGTPNVE